MKLIMFPLLFSIGFLAYENRDKIADQYNAAYPPDPGKAAALNQCIGENRGFNRLDPDDRERCYRRYLAAPSPVELPPVTSPFYAYSPSHLAGNDIRRQEANESYHPAGGLISTAEAAPLPKPAASTPTASAHLASPIHRAATHHLVAQHIAAFPSR